MRMTQCKELWTQTQKPWHHTCIPERDALIYLQLLLSVIRNSSTGAKHWWISHARVVASLKTAQERTRAGISRGETMQLSLSVPLSDDHLFTARLKWCITHILLSKRSVMNMCFEGMHRVDDNTSDKSVSSTKLPFVKFWHGLGDFSSLQLQRSKNKSS